MPTSNIGSFENGLRLILKLNPDSILDVGPGFGTWAFLSRMYLDMRRDQTWKGVSNSDWSRRIEGVEAFRPYAKAPHMVNLYDEIHDATALMFFEQLGVTQDKKYDLTILSHVLEHMPKADGLFVLKRALEISGSVIVGLPLDCSTEDRDPFFENEHERHASDWAGDIDGLIERSALHFIEEGTNLLAWLKGDHYEDRTPNGWEDSWRSPAYLR